MWEGLTKKLGRKNKKKTKFLPRVPSLALGEEALSRVPGQGTRGRLEKKKAQQALSKPNRQFPQRLGFAPTEDADGA